MTRILLFLTVVSLFATPTYAGLRPILYAGYNIEDGDFEGSSSAPLLGAGLESEIFKSIVVGGDYMLALQDHPSNPGRISYLEGGVSYRTPVSSMFSPRIGGGMGLAFDSRGDKAVGGLWFFDVGLEISTRNTVLEAISIQYRPNTFTAATVHRIFVGFGF